VRGRFQQDLAAGFQPASDPPFVVSQQRRPVARISTLTRGGTLDVSIHRYKTWKIVAGGAWRCFITGPICSVDRRVFDDHLVPGSRSTFCGTKGRPDQRRYRFGSDDLVKGGQIRRPSLPLWIVILIHPGRSGVESFRKQCCRPHRPADMSTFVSEHS
jgi:hypothetical protein